MLLGLRHHTIVSGDCEEHKVDGMSARQHVPDKALVPWNVHDPDPRPIRHIEMREAQVDGDSSLLFLLETVGIRARQRFYEARLPMIDMAGRSDEQRHGQVSQRQR